jgi:hypothetical protein
VPEEGYIIRYLRGCEYPDNLASSPLQSLLTTHRSRVIRTASNEISGTAEMALEDHLHSSFIT